MSTDFGYGLEQGYLLMLNNIILSQKNIMMYYPYPYPYPYPSLFSHAKHRCAECSISCLTTHYKLQLLLSFHVYLSSLQHYHITFSYICVCFLCFVCSRIAFATEVLRGLVSEVTRAPGSGLPFLCCISISSLLSDFSWCGRTLSETPRVSTW